MRRVTQPLAVLVIFATLQYVTSLQCYTCTNCESEKECLEKGEIKKCGNSDSCMLERRFGSNRANVYITKACKQKRACESAAKQNPWKGDEQELNSVSFSCCNKDKCNDENMNVVNKTAERLKRNEEIRKAAAAAQRAAKSNNVLSSVNRLGLKLYDFSGVTSCPKFEAISHGRMRCSSQQNVGSQCRFYCNKKYFLRGPRTIYCRRDGSWSSPPPTCGSFNCQPEPFNVENGYSYCRAAEPTRTVCRFGCRWTHRLQGPPISSCMINLYNPEMSYWNRPVPTCINRFPTCEKPKNNEGLVHRCTRGLMAGSYCTFSCPNGYLLQGKIKVYCQDNKDDTASWTDQLPTCKKEVVCEAHNLGETLHEGCTDGSYVGSVCEFTCTDPEADLIGNEMVKCVKTAEGKAEWDGSLPICKKPYVDLRECSSLQTSPRDFAVVSCSKSNKIGSKCSFVCPTHHIMIGEDNVSCVAGDDGAAVWSGKVPRCIGKCPRLEENPDVTRSCSKGLMEGSRCTFKCKSAKKAMVGSSIRLCMERRNGAFLWSGYAPRCEDYAQCKRPKLTEALVVECSDEVLYPGSRCYFSCKKGFALIGQSAAACKAFGHKYTRWDRLQPICRGICPSFGTFPNGKVKCNRESFVGSTCKFICHEHYELVGAKELNCGKVNNSNVNVWSDERPFCRYRPQCPTWQPSIRTIRTCTDGDYAGSVCTFDCRHNYNLNGPQTVECVQKDELTAEWSKTAPTCEGQCSELPLIANGRRQCTDQAWKNSVCTFTCDVNYVLIGESSTTCQHNYQNGLFAWSKEVPMCKELSQCSPLTQSEGLKIVCNNNDLHLGTICQLTCKNTYELVGPKLVKCINNNEDDTIWNNEPGICRGKCIEIDSIANGTVECVDSSYAESSCSFKCNEGFELKGANKITCSKDTTGLHQWDEMTPTCELRERCGELLLENGLISDCSDNDYLDSSCEFSCPPSSMLIGNTSTLCLLSDDGFVEWNTATPYCRDMCTNLGSLENGVTLCSEGRMSDSLCTFNCNDNYDLIGSSAVSCSKDENGKFKWNSTVPICREHPQCDEPNETEGLNFTCTNQQKLYPGSKCNAQCDKGYKMFGDTEIVCERWTDTEAGWSSRQPICIGECDFIESIENGKVDCNDTHYLESVCEFVCDEHHELIGSSSVTCLKNDDGLISWSHPLPECKLRPRCSEMATNDEKLSINCSDASYGGSICKFQCPLGHMLMGNDEISCHVTNETTASWSDVVPYCREICNDLAQIDNGEVTCSDEYFANSSCSFSCTDNSYELIGESQITCSLNQESIYYNWNHQVPTCQKRLKCMEFEDIRNIEASCSDESYAGSTCKFQCGKNQILIGSEEVSCREENGTTILSDSIPTCRSVCIEQLTPSNTSMTCSDEFFVNSTCTFTCDENFDLIGPSQINCNELHPTETYWSELPPVCLKTPECPSFLTAGAEIFDCTNDYYADSSCKFTCPPNYIMIGNDVMNCHRTNDTEAVWDNFPPLCQENCAEITHISSGNVNCSNTNILGSECRFMCEEKHDLIGMESALCAQVDGETDWTNEAPTCQRYYECDEVVSTAGLSINCSLEVRVGSQCQFSCQEGFQLQGEEETKCQKDGESDAEWSNSQPVCIATCKDIGNFSNGEAVCTNDNLSGSSCTFTCDEGYELIGSNVTHCTVQEGVFTAAWDQSIPVCQEIKKCKVIDESTGFPMFFCSNDNIYGSVCFFMCGATQVLIGEEEIVCGIGEDGDAEWSAVFPQCAEVCPEVEPMKNGKVICNNKNLVNSFCTFECDPGYNLSGAEFVSCGRTQYGNFWTSTFPICLPTCPEMEYIPNGVSHCTRDNTVGSSCSFMCDEHYELVGYEDARCVLSDDEKTASWSNDVPTCIEICPRVFNTKHKLCTNDYFVNSVCMFDCNDGNIPVISICNRTEVGTLEWTEQPPKCISKCPEISQPANGHMECDDEQHIGSTCLFKCNTGFSLTGRSQAICIQNSMGSSDWSSAVPQCLPICKPIRQMTGTRISCTRGNAVNSVCKITCERGYKIANIRKSFSICNFNSMTNIAEWTPYSGCIKL